MKGNRVVNWLANIEHQGELDLATLQLCKERGKKKKKELTTGKHRDLSDDQQTSSQLENLYYGFDDSTLLASRLRQNHISGNSLAAKTLALQQQLLLLRGGVGMAISPSSIPDTSFQGSESGLRPLPLSLAGADSSDSILG
uniref:Uncharacterized protein n=1 Tax=Nelumbo nucifera TaxID=4432 RepID=A0A822YSU8_NELNU|nr:TPA_asm: hypothetical protein HUJ06_005149 [Nelumbo nucifera]